MKNSSPFITLVLRLVRIFNIYFCRQYTKSFKIFDSFLFLGLHQCLFLFSLYVKYFHVVMVGDSSKFYRKVRESHGSSDLQPTQKQVHLAKQLHKFAESWKPRVEFDR